MDSPAHPEPTTPGDDEAGSSTPSDNKHHQSSSSKQQQQSLLWMDTFKAPLNPCTLDSFGGGPIALADGQQVWPVLLGCYELDPKLNRRLGQLNLYTIHVPDSLTNSSPQPTTNGRSMPLSFGPPQVLLDPKLCQSGILDCKWCPTQISHLGCCDGYNANIFATAHSSGEVRIHTFHAPTADNNGLPGATSADDAEDPLYTVKCNMGSSSKSSTVVSSSDPAPLCLSLNWGMVDTNTNADATSPSIPIVSSFSNGTIALYDVICLHDSIEVLERECWQGHELFGCPSEVWTAGISGQNTVISGGDDGKLKFWDVRCTLRPTQVMNFDAGVTCVSPHPNPLLSHLVACGGYDERIQIYDVRYVSNLKTPPLCQSRELGGGIWRIQWHPYNQHRLLVAAMHGGCRVVNIKGFDRYCREHPFDDDNEQHEENFRVGSSRSSSWDASADDYTLPMYAKVTKEFREHESMTYGAAWLTCRHPQHPNSYFEAAASCSFYDRTVRLWDSVF